MELAIQKDCETIIEGFILNENPRFESFVYQWKTTLFQRIYTAQSLSVEILQSTNACIHYAKRILSYKNTMPRLGALFLLYAIHFKQPTDRFHKIDVDLTSWLKIKEFLFCLDNMLYAEGAKCIFWDLLKENSFRFVASDTYYGLENLINLDKIRNSAEFNLSKTLYIFRNDLRYLTCQRGLFMGITKLEDGYSEMKELMNQSSAEDGENANNTAIPLSKTFEELKSAFNSLNQFIKSHCTHKSSIGRLDRDRIKKKKKKKGIKKIKREGYGRKLALKDIDTEIYL